MATQYTVSNKANAIRNLRGINASTVMGAEGTQKQLVAHACAGNVDAATILATEIARQDKAAASNADTSSDNQPTV